MRVDLRNMKLSKKKMLPRCWWLRKNGYSGLYRCVKKYPELFFDFELFKIDFLSFEEAKKIVRTLKIKTQKEYLKTQKEDLKSKNIYNIPAFPGGVYKNKGWIGWGDFLGTSSINLLFEEAKNFAISLKLKGEHEWRRYSKSGKRPINIPSNPNGFYKDQGWTGWGDFLGTGNAHKKDFLSFEECRKFIRNLKLKGHTEWQEYCKTSNRPHNIPSNFFYYKHNKNWLNAYDMLGTDNHRDFLTYIKAREFAINLGLNGEIEWRDYCKSGEKPNDIPFAPNSVYKNDGWINWGHWLGSKFQKGKWRPFQESKEFIKSLNLKRQTEWIEYCRSGNKPIDIPATPHLIYKDRGWKNMGDWIGTGYIACSKREYKSFKEARKFVRNLRLKNVKEWEEYSKSGKNPIDIPAHPPRVYKNKGWTNWYDFLGNK